MTIAKRIIGIFLAGSATRSNNCMIGCESFCELTCIRLETTALLAKISGSAAINSPAPQRKTFVKPRRSNPKSSAGRIRRNKEREQDRSDHEQPETELHNDQ